MAITIEQVRLAMNAVTAASPAERRHRLRELMKAGVALRELVRSYEVWIQKEDIWLTERFANPEYANDPEYWQRDQRWIDRIPIYTEALDVLGAVELMLKGQDADALPAVELKAVQGRML